MSGRVVTRSQEKAAIAFYMAELHKVFDSMSEDIDYAVECIEGLLEQAQGDDRLSVQSFVAICVYVYGH